MHTLTVKTKYTFGDRVQFDSPTQRCSGKGTIYAVTVDGQGVLDYMIRVDGEPDIQPGILEQEIRYLDTFASLEKR